MEENEVLVKVEGLSKKFCKDLKTSLKYGVQDLFSNWWGNKEERLLRDKEFWAVKEISFELRRGECLGLIGHNGAGKSTLLKILNGLIKPDAGKVTIKGKVGALIELGAGFNPILTGRENIYNNGAVLGFTRKEIDSKVEEIIDFSELREFIDMPVQNYSSGMKVRLGFAVAAQMEPDVLIIDEVLAVGDMGFVLKCFKTIDKILPKTAIIFVSHNIPMVSRLCTHILLMKKGDVVFQGIDVANGIDLYYNHFSTMAHNIIFTDHSLDFIGARLKNARIDGEKAKLNWKDNFTLELEFENNTLEVLPYITVSIYDKEQREVAILDYNQPLFQLSKESFSLEIEHKNLQLSKGVYSINLIVYKTSKLQNPVLRINNIVTLQVSHTHQSYPPFLLYSQIKIASNQKSLP